jgi:outer membrane receptor protein involved in Fe transport
VNLAYQTKSKWAFDFTSNLIGAKRLPSAYAVTSEKQSWSDFSLPFWLFNAQITKSFKKRVDVYLGCENIFDFKQLNPIVNSSKPYSSTFDATLIWGPVFGRMIYGGIRWRL